MVQPGLACILLLIFVDTSTPLINNSDIEALLNRTEAARSDPQYLQVLETRRKGKREKSTSSSGDGAKASTEEAGESLAISSVSVTSSNEKDKKKDRHPKSSAERNGWRKWHRKCTPCPEEMDKKWRDPTIKWICGAYQRARRSFKSLCMMHLRNCQDGTMFTKIHDHRCDNGSNIKPHGDHFFYEYRADLTDDSSDSKTKSETETSEDNSDSSV